MQNIETILEEIYKIEPALKNREGELIKIINSLIELKPEVKIDEDFIINLKSRLQSEYAVAVPRKNWFTFLNFRLVGSLTVLLFLIIVAAPFIKFKPSDTGQTNETPLVINRDDGSVVVKTNEGIVTKQSEAGKTIAGFVKFKSADEYKKYLADSDQGYYGFGGGIGGVRMDAMGSSEALPLPMTSQSMGMKQSEVPAPSRVSGTNVQVAGIDEPDILKTDGKEIYFAPAQRYYYARPMPMGAPVPEVFVDPGTIENNILPPPDYNQPKTNVIKAFPADKLSKDGVIDKTGDLLLSGNILVIFEQQNIYGYDVSNPKNPTQKWNVEINSKNSFVEARLYDGAIYLVTSTYANRHEPCPIPILKSGGQEITVRCDNIYHPIGSLPVNVNYHISTINPTTGKLVEGISFVGAFNSTVYMSKNGIYVAYSQQGDFLKLILDLFAENGDIIQKEIVSKLEKLMTYDISDASKMSEFQIIYRDYLNSLGNDEALKIENEISNRAGDYFKKHKRELTKTDIVKITTGSLKVDAMGTVPGNLLNQFSMDEFEANLRVATTITDNGFMGFGNRGEQENDIYVLDTNLSKIGSIEGLGLGERIYSARFIEDKGYLVTFKQTDPFFVLDLSNPARPQVKGELKIPGYSAYLHPINKDRILGVGKEGSKVKVSLFDVSDAANPREASKFVLEEYWSDILNTHHAFLLDSRHKVFFMPGGNGGYVFSYDGDKLSIKKAVSDISAKRAVFIDDYMYIAGDNKIVVLDENSWERKGQLDL